jgi:POT family proton-dependent oligopeptide transporter
VTAAPSLDHGFFGHPRGLGYLAFTEAWERFSFFGMQTLLVLYMVGDLFQPEHIRHVVGLAPFRHALEAALGPLSAQGLASIIFGLYSGLAYLMPVFGGIIGDRLLGQHRMVMSGAVLMALGHFLMVYEALFLPALVLLIIGSGCLKGNLATQVGSLYAPGDRREVDAFQIFSVGINVGVVLAPLICGTLGELLGWAWGFGAAGVGMLIGLAIYVAGRAHLPADLRRRGAPGARQRLAPGDWRTILALLAVLLIVTCFLIPGGQLGNVYPLWILHAVDRAAPGFVVPVTWFQSATAIVSVVWPPLLLHLWRWQAARRRESGNLGKIGWGCVASAAAFSLLAILAAFAADGADVSWTWLLLFHFLYGMGYLYVWPVGMALFARAAPAAVRSMFIGLYYLALFIANNLAGWIGHFYERLSPPRFWAMQVLCSGGGAVAVLLFGAALNRALAHRRLP